MTKPHQLYTVKDSLEVDQIGFWKNPVLFLNNSISYAWIDDALVCQKLIDFYKSNESFRKVVEVEQAQLDKLKEVIVWIKDNDKILESSLYEFYYRYLTDKKYASSEDIYLVKKISQVSDLGPFKDMTISDFFNEEVFNSFIKVLLIRKELPFREFRFRVNSLIAAEVGMKKSEHLILNLDQICENGIMLKTTNEIFLNKIRKQDRLKVMFNWSLLDNIFHNDNNHKDAFYTHLRSYLLSWNVADIGVNSGYDYNRTKSLYLFLSLDKINEGDGVLVQDKINSIYQGFKQFLPQKTPWVFR